MKKFVKIALSAMLVLAMLATLAACASTDVKDYEKKYKDDGYEVTSFDSVAMKAQAALVGLDGDKLDWIFNAVKNDEEKKSIEVVAIYCFKESSDAGDFSDKLKDEQKKAEDEESDKVEVEIKIKKSGKVVTVTTTMTEK